MRVNRLKLLFIVSILLLLSVKAFASSSIYGINQTAAATDNAWTSYESWYDFVRQTSIDGKLRAYYFTRNHLAAPNQSAFAIGGQINVLTAPLYGFSVGTSFYTAQNLGLNNPNPIFVDPTVPGQAVSVMGQGFLQFKFRQLLLRGGYQLIDTPWLGPSDSRVIPATYYGLYGTFSPIESLTFTALRIFDFKGWTANTFSPTNLYNTNNLGGTPIPTLGTTPNRGTLALGATTHLKEMGVNAQAWYYQFYDFANMFYVEGNYHMPKNSWLVRPIVGIQALNETASGSNLIDKATGKSVGSNVLGALLGIENEWGSLTVAYNTIPQNASLFRGGDIVSPYTSGYATDPLYTTSMKAGLIEKGAGQAYKATATIFLLEKQLRIITSYGLYYTNPIINNTREFDFDVTYFFTGPLKGLSIRNRLGVLNGVVETGQLINNRIMLQYEF